jgi:hypothetical protein
MAAGNDVTVTSVGTQQIGGRLIRLYHITFGAATTKYSAQGWDFTVDAATGVLVAYTIHYSDAAGGGSEDVTVNGLSTAPIAAPTATSSLPAGYQVQGVVNLPGGSAQISDQVQTGDTIGAVAARLQIESASAVTTPISSSPVSSTATPTASQ